MSPLLRRDEGDPSSMPGMDMSMDPDSPSSSFGEGMSTAFYASTDTSPSLWLSAFTPTSPGAVAAACLALAVLACAYRLLNALERLLVRGWTEQALKRDRVREERRIRGGGRNTLPQGSEDDGTMDREQGGRRRRKRGGPGWWAEVGVPRGLYQVLLSGVGYLLMLSVMTFNVYYFISILLGLGLGESLFGRFGRSPPSHQRPSASSSGAAGTECSSSSSGGFRSFSGEGSPLELDGTRLEELNERGKRYEGGQAGGGRREEGDHNSALRRPLLLRGDGMATATSTDNRTGTLSSTSSGSSVKVQGTEGTEDQEQAHQMGIGVAR
ncbi:hypothetical protein BCV69DRAFT_162590 [Microstroma glucosiphilum]|uniref:Copper transport protein n=1 Tax=Pseudomicrostroma glucosiphilum TaxID=1684307 RepID=A0A316UA26_9BASI|nr:hypothetical protein BCV69DRAFT_162590 [Pseudomicrostroma glucosiphilum]PWN22022.1 hypothetical protein BCV69DRAFT_162590 [Pseudomicrostroma glucosiphilum]